MDDLSPAAQVALRLIARLTAFQPRHDGAMKSIVWAMIRAEMVAVFLIFNPHLVDSDFSHTTNATFRHWLQDRWPDVVNLARGYDRKDV